MDDATWNTRRILNELCDAERRTAIARAFWKNAAPETRRNGVGVLARAIRFRDQKVKEASVDRKAAWCVSRIQDPNLGSLWTEALALYHLTEQKGLMAACLDAWGVPHQDGVVDGEGYPFPTAEQLAASLPALCESWPQADVALYLATAGFVMGHDDARWREATWPAVENLVEPSAPHA